MTIPILQHLEALKHGDRITNQTVTLEHYDLAAGVKPLVQRTCFFYSPMGATMQPKPYFFRNKEIKSNTSMSFQNIQEFDGFLRDVLGIDPTREEFERKDSNIKPIGPYYRCKTEISETQRHLDKSYGIKPSEQGLKNLGLVDIYGNALTSIEAVNGENYRLVTTGILLSSNGSYRKVMHDAACQSGQYTCNSKDMDKQVGNNNGNIEILYLSPGYYYLSVYKKPISVSGGREIHIPILTKVFDAISFNIHLHLQMQNTNPQDASFSPGLLASQKQKLCVDFKNAMSRGACGAMTDRISAIRNACKETSQQTAERNLDGLNCEAVIAETMYHYKGGGKGGKGCVTFFPYPQSGKHFKKYKGSDQWTHSYGKGKGISVQNPLTSEWSIQTAGPSQLEGIYHPKAINIRDKWVRDKLAEVGITANFNGAQWKITAIKTKKPKESDLTQPGQKISLSKDSVVKVKTGKDHFTEGKNPYKYSEDDIDLANAFLENALKIAEAMFFEPESIFGPMANPNTNIQAFEEVIKMLEYYDGGIEKASSAYVNACFGIFLQEAFAAFNKGQYQHLRSDIKDKFKKLIVKPSYELPSNWLEPECKKYWEVINKIIESKPEDILEKLQAKYIEFVERKEIQDPLDVITEVQLESDIQLSGQDE